MKPTLDIVVVMGMHRSGTSAMARALEVLGVEIGDTLMPPVKGDNDKGYFEDLDLYALNEKILNAVNSNWEQLSFIDVNHTEHLVSSEYFLEAVDLLRNKRKGKAILGVKDPRFSKLILFWRKVINYCEFNAAYIIMVRNPISVIRSMGARGRTDKQKDYYLWVTHTLSALIHSEAQKRIIIKAEDFLAKPKSTLIEIAEKFNLKFDQESYHVYENEFLEKRLVHHDYEEKDLSIETNLPDIVNDCYLKILTSKNTDELQKFIDSVEIKYLNQAFKYMEEINIANNSMRKKMEGKIKECQLNVMTLEQEASEFSKKLDSKEAGLDIQISEINNMMSHINHFQHFLGQTLDREFPVVRSALDKMNFEINEGALHSKLEEVNKNLYEANKISQAAQKKSEDSLVLLDRKYKKCVADKDTFEEELEATAKQLHNSKVASDAFQSRILLIEEKLAFSNIENAKLLEQIGYLIQDTEKAKKTFAKLMESEARFNIVTAELEDLKKIEERRRSSFFYRLFAGISN